MPLISLHALHQLHIFIFFLALFHVIYSAITMTLGRLKVMIQLFLSNGKMDSIYSIFVALSSICMALNLDT